MKTLAYIGATSLAVALAVLLLLAKTPFTSPGQEGTQLPSPSPSAGIPTPTNPPPAAPTARPALAAEFLKAPLSYTSVSGATVEIRDLEYGPNCLRLQALASGLPAPVGAPVEDTTLVPFTSITLIEPTTSITLSPTQIGGGGGGGQAADGTMFIGQEAVYRFAPQHSPEGLVLLTIQVTTNDALGFEEPLAFNMQATPSDSQDCGLQGTISP